MASIMREMRQLVWYTSLGEQGHPQNRQSAGDTNFHLWSNAQTNTSYASTPLLLWKKASLLLWQPFTSSPSLPAG